MHKRPFNFQRNIKLLPSLFQREFSNNLPKFKKDLSAAHEVVVLSGAGISRESGIPTFREKDGLWRGFDTSILANPASFRDDPGLVWEFYHYRRELVLRCKPNDECAESGNEETMKTTQSHATLDACSVGHLAIARYEAQHPDKKVTVVTQNIDGLHAKAGSNFVIELHGNLFKTRCTRCNDVLTNTDSPICEALRGKGSPNSQKLYSDIPEKDLPHCKRQLCEGLLRPHVVWFGERLDLALVDILDPILSKCNVLLVIGTSSLVFPAAAYPTVMAAGGSIVAEFNIEPKPSSSMFDYYFSGPSATTLPQALND